MPQERIRFTKKAHAFRSFHSGSLFKHTSDREYERPVRLRRKPGGGYQPYNPPLQDPKFTEIIAALKATRSRSVTIGVLGTLAATPDEYDPNEYPPFERLYLARILRTANTLARMQAAYARYGNDTFQLRELLSDLMGFQWSTLDTVYVAERAPI